MTRTGRTAPFVPEAKFARIVVCGVPSGAGFAANQAREAERNAAMTARRAGPGCVSGFVALAALLAAPALAQTAHEAVNCLDESRGTIHKTLAADCAGRLVSDEEAASFREQRRDYIRKVLSQAPFPEIAGKSLAGLGSGFFIAADGSVVTSHSMCTALCSAASVYSALASISTASTPMASMRSNASESGL